MYFSKMEKMQFNQLFVVWVLETQSPANQNPFISGDVGCTAGRGMGSPGIIGRFLRVQIGGEQFEGICFRLCNIALHHNIPQCAQKEEAADVFYFSWRISQKICSSKKGFKLCWSGVLMKKCNSHNSMKEPLSCKTSCRKQDCWDLKGAFLNFFKM